ncbi:MAG TPA: hypothetical protein VFH39_01815 [Candidatus Saccharimonadales bacterium]|nr:hypothetical protein [Candidatus Saccharimonadales bacterium]
MLLSLLSKFLASLLVASITLVTLVVLFSQTLLSSHYIEGQLSATHSYSRLSVALSDELIQQASDQGAQVDPSLKQELQGVLSPVVMQQKLSLALEELQTYYQGKGPAPQINVSDLVARARAVGVQVPPDSNLDQPITFAAGRGVKGAGKTYAHVKWLLLAAAAVLAGLLLLVCWKRRRWVALPDVFIGTGVLLGLSALVFGFGAGIAERYVSFGLASNAFTAIGHDLAVAISHDLGRRLVIIAICYLVVGVALRIMVAHHHPKTRSVPAKAPQRPNL